jgi:hypothetical protein
MNEAAHPLPADLTRLNSLLSKSVPAPAVALRFSIFRIASRGESSG